jgi:hypothetical protein
VDHNADASFYPELQRTGVEVAGLTFFRHTYARRHQCLPSLSSGRCAFCFERQREHGQRTCPPTHSAHLPLCYCSHCRPAQLTGARQGEPNTHTTVLWATALSPSLLRPSDYWASLHGLTLLIGRPRCVAQRLSLHQGAVGVRSDTRFKHASARSMLVCACHSGVLHACKRHIPVTWAGPANCGCEGLVLPAYDAVFVH